jgi:hypothetical protein
LGYAVLGSVFGPLGMVAGATGAAWVLRRELKAIAGQPGFFPKWAERVGRAYWNASLPKRLAVGGAFLLFAAANGTLAVAASAAFTPLAVALVPSVWRKLRASEQRRNAVQARAAQARDAAAAREARETEGPDVKGPAGPDLRGRAQQPRTPDLWKAPDTKRPDRGLE